MGLKEEGEDEKSYMRSILLEENLLGKISFNASGELLSHLHTCTYMYIGRTRSSRKSPSIIKYVYSIDRTLIMNVSEIRAKKSPIPLVKILFSGQ